MGRSSNHPSNSWENEPYSSSSVHYNDVHFTHHGDADSLDFYYGHSYGAHIVPTASGGGYQMSANEGFNQAGTVYMTNQIWGYIPGGGYGNIKYLPLDKIVKFRWSVTTPTRLTNIAKPSVVPDGAKGLITTMYTFQNRGHLDHIVHSFGRNSAHSTSPWSGNVRGYNQWLNDILITSEGDASGDYHYGSWRGSQIFGLKSNGQFEARMAMGKSISLPHYIIMYIVGYIM
jgi:hypothetical protein